MNKKRDTIILICALTLCAGVVVHAQIATESLSGSLPPASFQLPSVNENRAPFSNPKIVQPLTLTATPSSPSPGESVTVEAQIATSDPDRAFFDWTIDGVAQPGISGTGKNTYTYTAGAVGSATRISVRVDPMNDTPVSAALRVYATDLALTWTADTFVPKWYKGKALPTPNSPLHVAAIPTFIINGSTIPPDRLIYTWSVSGNRALKGVGKNTFFLTESDQSWDTPIIVLTVEDADRQIHKEVRLGIPSQEPHAVIYQVLPLGGVEFRRGTSAFPPLAPGLVDLQVEPFFFNTTTRHDLAYQWSVETIFTSTSPQNPFLLTLDTSTQQPPVDIPVGIIVKQNQKDSSASLASTFLRIPIRK